MLREGFEPFEQRWTNLQAGRDLEHQRLEIMLEMIRIALSVSARESTLVEWSRADFGQWMGREPPWLHWCAARKVRVGHSNRFGPSMDTFAALHVFRQFRIMARHP